MYWLCYCNVCVERIGWLYVYVLSVVFAGMEFTDSQLSPFTDYRYQLEAHNGVGSTRSPVVTYRTLAGTPAGVITLTVQDVTARAASFAWTPPVTGVNGVVTEYRLRSTTLSTATPVVHYRGLSLATRLHTLAPFEHYRFDAQVCTDGGCLTSAALGVTMLQDLPKGQRPPSVSGVSPTALLVRWQPPEHPNGQSPPRIYFSQSSAAGCI